MGSTEFPVSAYYHSHVIDGQTIARGGGWWSAVLLIRDPRDQSLFIGLYRWQETAHGWKTRGSFKLRTDNQIQRALVILHQFLRRMDPVQASGQVTAPTQVDHSDLRPAEPRAVDTMEGALPKMRNLLESA